MRDSHDRYANLEVSYLLQRMETYRGVAILTTNMQNSLDIAFQRRLRFVAHFPFPDAESRERIWRNVFPAAAPTQDLDYARLAQLNVTGGSIRNIAMLAAFLAADEGEPIAMRHMLAGAQTEYGKLGQTPVAGGNPGVDMKTLHISIDRLVVEGVAPAQQRQFVDGIAPAVERIREGATCSGARAGKAAANASARWTRACCGLARA